MPTVNIAFHPSHEIAFADDPKHARARIKVAQGKLYKTKSPITVADILNDRVSPFYEQHGLPVLRILTDRGNGIVRTHQSARLHVFLAINNIDHTKKKVSRPTPTASANGSTRAFCRRSIMWHSAQKSMRPSNSCRMIWTNVSIAPTMNAHRLG